MRTADKRGKEKRNLSDYFELTEQTYEHHQGSLFKKKCFLKKRPSLTKTKSKPKQNPNSLLFYLNPNPVWWPQFRDPSTRCSQCSRWSHLGLN